ncbi:unnamed protein product [Prunus armeniaca]
MGDIIVEKVAMVKIQISGLQPWSFELVYSAVVGVVEAPPKLGLLQQDLSTQNQKQEQQTQVYVVYIGENPSAYEASDIATICPSFRARNCSWKTYDVLVSSCSTLAARESLIYSYSRSFNGFVAKFLDEEATILGDGRRCLSNALLQLHTTRSWDFPGLSPSHVKHIKEGDEIIGMMDSGIWPESESFSDKGFGPPPINWKGTCNTNKTFTCNNKIIGARYYNSQNFYDTTDIIPLRDSVGHGTHTASIAAGREVAGASVFGLAQGIARGGIPNARIAVYKVCWAMGCSIADILAAFDDAIADGVDIISASFGKSAAYTFTDDPVAIGSFHALRKGILTITAAGNYGPLCAPISIVSPWLLTVGASTIDRKFVTQLALGNGKTFMGSAINNFDLKGDMFPLIWGGDASNYPVNANSETSKYCNAGDLDSQKIKGKIVLCNYRSNGILHTDGVGVIMPFQSVDDPAFSYHITTTLISPEEIPKVLDYIKTSK